MKKSLYEWSSSEFSHLPWRKNRTLYKTLVSEIMLQQTNVSTVLKHFERFLSVYPNVQSLASSTEEEVCSHWQGLGYYRRARNLRKAAISIVDDFNGKFPKKFEDLISIPGIGAYTANALIAIGRNESALALDANLERVFSRVYGIKEYKGPKLLKMIQSREEEILKDFKINTFGARVINESVMDLGRVYCQAKKADCLLCPIKNKCTVFTKGLDPLSFPLVKEKKKKFFELKLLRIVVKEGNKLYAYVKNDEQWLSGQWEIPTFVLYSEDMSLKQYPILDIEEDDEYHNDYEELKMIKTAITKYKISNYIKVMDKASFNSFLKDHKFKLSSYSRVPFLVDEYHFSSTTLKCLTAISDS